MVVHFCQQLFVHEKCRNGLYISFLTNNYLVSTNDELIIIIQRYKKCSTPMIECCVCVPTSATLYGSYLIATNAIVYLQLLQARCCSNITGNDQAKTSVCRISFDGSSAKVSLFSSRNILLYWSYSSPGLMNQCSCCVLGEQPNIAVAASAQVEETCTCDAIDPESSRDRRST